MQVNISGANFNSDDVIAYAEVQELLPAVFISYECSSGGYYQNPTQTNLEIILKGSGRLVVRNFSAHDYRLLVDGEYTKAYKRFEKEEEILLNLESNLKKEKSYRKDKEIFDMRYKSEHPILSLFLSNNFNNSEQFKKLLKDYRIQKLAELDKE